MKSMYTRLATAAIFIGAFLGSVFLIYELIKAQSAPETRLQCFGTISSPVGVSDKVLEARLFTFRWWMGAWSDSDGALVIESASGRVLGRFDNIRQVGEEIHIYDLDYQLKGKFFASRRLLSLELDTGRFEGICL